MLELVLVKLVGGVRQRQKRDQRLHVAREVDTAGVGGVQVQRVVISYLAIRVRRVDVRGGQVGAGEVQARLELLALRQLVHLGLSAAATATRAATSVLVVYVFVCTVFRRRRVAALARHVLSFVVLVDLKRYTSDPSY